MAYQLFYTRKAVKYIQKLDSVVKKKLDKSLRAMAENPFQNTKKLTDSKLGTYRYRIGDYRVIFDITGNKIIVLRLGHRKEVYQ